MTSQCMQTCVQCYISVLFLQACKFVTVVPKCFTVQTFTLSCPFVQLWDVRRKGCIFTYKGHSEVINSIQFSPDGKWVVSASSDSTTKVQVGLVVVKGHAGCPYDSTIYTIHCIVIYTIHCSCYKHLASLLVSHFRSIVETCDCHRCTRAT